MIIIDCFFCSRLYSPIVRPNPPFEVFQAHKIGAKVLKKRRNCKVFPLFLLYVQLLNSFSQKTKE